MSTATQTSDQGKSDLLARATELACAGKGTGGPPHETVGALLRAYFRYVAPEDLGERSDADVFGALASHHRLAARRSEGEARIRVLTPTLAEQGWSAGGHSVVEIVTDDMPFLVDSVTMELARQLRDVHLVVHPHFDVRRDDAGTLLEVVPVADSGRAPDDGWQRESWMHLEIDRVPENDPDEGAGAIVAQLQRVLRDVRLSVEDWGASRARLRDLAFTLREQPPTGIDADEVRQATDLLDWLTEDHFTFLGARDYDLDVVDGEDVLRAVDGSGLGILRADEDRSTSFARMPGPVRAKAREKTLLVLAKANSRATVHRPAYLDYVGVKTFDEAGNVTGERRFLGLFSSSAYAESLMRVPLLRDKAEEVLRRSGFDPRSYAGRALMDTLESYPRDELFHTPVAELASMATTAMHARERRSVRAITRADTYGRYVSVLVYLPRDRYNTAVRERFSQILLDQLGGSSVEFTVRIHESTTARVHFVVHLPQGEHDPTVTGTLRVLDPADLERRLVDASRSWRDDFVAAVLAEHGEHAGSRLVRRYGDAFPEAYKEDFSPRTAAVDLGRLEEVRAANAAAGVSQGLDLALYERLDAGRGEVRLKVFRVGPGLSLSRVLPMLSSLGVEVVDERPYELDDLDEPTYVYEFGLRYGAELPESAKTLVTDALRAIWDRHAETDGFNRLVLAAGLTWREVAILRAYAKYMRQGGSPFGGDTIQEALAVNVDITRLLVRLFTCRFEPSEAGGPSPDKREHTARTIAGHVERALDDVVSLDHDRILRSYLTHVQATLRTNYFQTDEDGRPKSYLSLKLEPKAIPDLPQPRPRFEIFVYSPRVEGVHLRFGPVARGGLRWSDRRDDFRTEVLGLVKAQMVKNTVIVPVGAKGGFYAKDLPDPSVDRDAWMAEGKAAYRTFISGLLDITDNLVDGATVPPPRVVRHDGDDSYLVVAADKGTATFSDIANGVAQDYGFWLGDAFASGGSVGYDHKAMGITARGAWVSVQRHFRERGVDCQREDFTAVGVGDMSGDVFGNGMLLSEHTRLVAAFDHRDVFLDPHPDAAVSYAERKRLFELPRSSWRDYDASLISEGGGVFSRQAKSVPVSAQVRALLGLADDVTHLAPNDLLRAILTADVDLLWNGGIGTYVKASTESHADAGDKANDAIRVDGRELRAKIVGEGGNLGLTQAGRIEYARAGGAINTDFIDNSAGVDTSDHEVNIKILLDRVVADGDLTGKQRNQLLAQMTDEVASLVLRDNREQNLALANSLLGAPALVNVHEDQMLRLEDDGVLSREVEGLPTTAEVQRRAENNEGLTAPELSVLLAWTKIVLAEDLLASGVADEDFLHRGLPGYFPSAMREKFTDAIATHPLRREIVVTQVVNEVVNAAGITFVHRLTAETGATVPELVVAMLVAEEVVGSRALVDGVRALDFTVDAGLQTRLRIELRTLVERTTRWLVGQHRVGEGGGGAEAVVAGLAEPVRATMAALPELVSGHVRTSCEEHLSRLTEAGVPDELARSLSVLGPAAAVPALVELALEQERDPAEVTRVWFALAERLGLSSLEQRILALPRHDRWQSMARAALREDLAGVHLQLTAQVLAASDDGRSADERVEAWRAGREGLVDRASSTVTQLCAEEGADLARLSVGLRTVRSLTAAR
ncbi:NAD-glutamate dehydrogenase [Nocardioides bruguierae]|uniref:NAD-glutamate dehydrogenase n=1 Tax=Nocardioides bruguierae TaxID=2945102 RepID=UPI00202283CB|nr:NAD-glutamate dehydrogenase [Nocardioides bruguierae]MCL8025682.1 NAD-glutamate dehydrogenase [Nocardioides bruguierae]